MVRCLMRALIALVWITFRMRRARLHRRPTVDWAQHDEARLKVSASGFTQGSTKLLSALFPGTR
jgi:hypothetical protein